MTCQEALTAATRKLKSAGIDMAARDARRLLAHVLGVDTARITLCLPDDIDVETCAKLDRAVHERAKRRPMSHIVGGREFFGRWFEVSEDVLDPRPETECLIEICKSEPFQTILDVGLGSGCILLTLLCEIETASGLGTDVSQAAVRMARRNADAIGVSHRAEIVVSDWFNAVSGRFDLVVSNPPYIRQDEMAELAPELAYEPRIALTDGADGLTAYRRIAKGARGHLAKDGRLVVEIGWKQAQSVTKILLSAGYSNVQCHPDLDGRDRVIVARWRG